MTASAEEARLQVLASYGVLDTPPEQEFDDLVHLTSRLAGTPVALVSLIDVDRQWFKARVGFPHDETGLDRSVCKFVLDEPDLLIIPDLAQDARTRENPLVTGEAAIRFYAGAPLRTSDGVTLGSLCAIDTAPRPDGLSEQQKQDLRVLARETMRQLEARRSALRLQAINRRDRALVRLGDRLRDLSDPAAMAYAAAEIMGQTLEASGAGYAVLSGRARDIVTVEAEWGASDGVAVTGSYDLASLGTYFEDLKRGEIVIIPDVRTDPRTATTALALEARSIRTLINIPIVERGELVALQFVHYDRPQAWSAENEAFVRNVADRTRAGIERVRAEEQQAVVNQEIGHRLKNTMAMVQAIASQTLKGVADRGAVQAFDQRLRALSTAHDVLIAGAWTSADLAGVVCSAMDNLGEGGRCDIEGPPVALDTRATLSTSLLVHELTTNALKYGALSRPEGRVAIRWRLEGGDDAQLVLEWRERGGPEVSPPSRKGFGSRLLSMGLVGTGGAALAYGANGFSATFTASLRQVQAP